MNTQDLHFIIEQLSKRRPVFHSEADFQLQLAWEIQKSFPSVEIYLEKPIDLDPRIYLDIVVKDEDSSFALELKYRTRNIQTQFKGEKYFLKDHGAQDQGRYDYLKDVSRLEKVREKLGWDWFALMLSNDTLYQKPSTRKITVDEAFRIHEGKKLNGILKWSENAGKGTTKGREVPIILSGNYLAEWRYYSKIDSPRHPVFNYLALCSFM
ncbi:MAG: hypothetical protein NWE88_12860 [Candidatus Bathyarchaeota archaeon]|nr:hypothetical protein [Candidatus Bathyarchaeota archaeon]